MDCGGIERAAISLLRAIPKDKFDVHLILNHKKGAFLKYLPEEIQIHELKVSDDYKKRIALGDKRWMSYTFFHLKFKQFFQTATVILYKLLRLPEKARLAKAHQLSEQIDFTKTKFDFVCAYTNIEQLEHADFHYDSKYRLYWLHCELNEQREDFKAYEKLFLSCDRIFGVSEKATNSFNFYFPHLKDRTTTYLNLIDVSISKKFSEEYIAKRPNKKIWFLTVGRLTPQKGIDIIPDIALRLKNNGIDFAWSVIGDGPLHNLLSEKTKKYGLDSDIIIEGEIDNPYPYFKDCDIYLQPSRYEGFCITVAEARMFEKPIVATDFAGASEQLENGKCGKIVEFGIDTFTNGILEVINNSDLRKNYVDNLRQQKIDTTDSISFLTNYMQERLSHNE